LTTIRWAVGVTDQAVSVATGSDTAAGNYAEIMYSSTGTYTGLTDTTHFVFITKDGTTQNPVACSVSADTSFHYFAIWEDLTKSKWVNGMGRWISPNAEQATLPTFLRLARSCALLILFSRRQEQAT
jgi:hypothetical protein